MYYKNLYIKLVIGKGSSGIFLFIRETPLDTVIIDHRSSCKVLVILVRF